MSAHRNPISAYVSRNRNRLNRIQDLLDTMRDEAHELGTPFDSETAEYIIELFNFCYIKLGKPKRSATEVQS